MKRKIQDRQMVVFTPDRVNEEKAWKLVAYFRAFCVEL
jgi:hypothetical protein